MLIPVTLFILYVDVCEDLRFKNRGEDDTEGFCYGRNFQMGLEHSKHPAKNAVNLFDHASHLQEELTVSLNQLRKEFIKLFNEKSDLILLRHLEFYPK